ncbi:unnamed protein product [Adineta steineri]|uniref:Protein sleepless n=1 Tax=Adineta steineri TaxID=433720 RepID=A0A818KN33_9BILA|nr:unnamed protein product [Adineta steineri]CAF1492108.1 unnamed protein product [Adineta steineri]CAF3563281.1 unnamed protein product [Adineta steineri]CAF4092606.1 unnamed protein product [Adineta steineri]
MQSIYILLLTLGCISIVSTYQCYQCHGESNGDCNDPFNATGGITDYDKEEASPGEICVKAKLKTNGRSTIERDTNSNGLFNCVAGENGCKKYINGDLTATICCCTSDLCNAVSIVQQKPLIVLLTMSTLVMFTYRWY